jgi:colanic acid biosynthesis glycosyl transferase WcaI
MRFLISSINFAPDHAGIGVYSTDFPLYLAEVGHEVSMVTGFSYYPRWEKRKEDEGKFFESETYQGVSVLRGYLYVPKRASTIKRLFHELTFCFFAGINLLRVRRPSAIVIFTPPFFLGFSALMASWFHRCPLVVNIQDLPLDAALALGMIKPSPISKFMLLLEGWLYRRAELVVTISDSMMENVLAKGVDRKKTLLVPNWVDVKKYSKTRDVGIFRGKYPQAVGKTCVAYAGNLGVKQGVDLLLKLAQAQCNDPSFHFFIIGDGADKVRLQEMAAEMKLPNVTFLPFFSPDDYLAMLADVEIIFVAQRSGAGNNFFPSKLLGLMAQRKALLVAADEDSELAKKINESHFGLISRYGDVDGLVKNLRRLGTDATLRRELGENGFKTVQAYDRTTVLAAWSQRIAEVVTKARG